MVGLHCRCVDRESPLPAAADERTRLLDRVMRACCSPRPTPEETTAFTADASPAALNSLADTLAVRRPGLTPFTGGVDIRPHHVPRPPRRPECRENPADRQRSRPLRSRRERPARRLAPSCSAARIVNEASIQFVSPDPTRPASGKPHEIRLPDGYNTWAAAWVRGSTVLWVLQEGTIRRYDFTNPADVKETNLEQPANLGRTPKLILDALRAKVDLFDVPPATASPRPRNRRETRRRGKARRRSFIHYHPLRRGGGWNQCTGRCDSGFMVDQTNSQLRIEWVFENPVLAEPGPPRLEILSAPFATALAAAVC